MFFRPSSVCPFITQMCYTYLHGAASNSHLLVVGSSAGCAWLFLHFRLVKMSHCPSHPIRRIANTLRGNPQGTEIWANVSGAAEESLTRRIWTTLRFIRSSLRPRRNLPFFFIVNRHVSAEATGVKTRQDTWNRIATQAQEYLKAPPWKRAYPVGDIGVMSSKIFRRMGMRQYPLCIQPHTALDKFDPWSIVCIR